MSEEDQHKLAAFQGALLNLLAEDLPSEELRRHLTTDPAFAPYQDYIATFEPRMVEVAAELVKKWGQR